MQSAGKRHHPQNQPDEANTAHKRMHKITGHTPGTQEVINVRVSELRRRGYNSLVEWLDDPAHVYIGRSNPHVHGAVQSKWHNPFGLQKYGRQGCLQRYEEYILGNAELLNDLPELKGKILGCWCAPEPCHGHILARLVAERVKGHTQGNTSMSQQT